jgi:hypothetical protein
MKEIFNEEFPLIFHILRDFETCCEEFKSFITVVSFKIQFQVLILKFCTQLKIEDRIKIAISPKLPIIVQ